ncbi:MAG: STAS domain-containing protein [Kineosporiaceae bacterium]|nr:STAS domain-containing protein [Kineosporiaceae bacterium]
MNRLRRRPAATYDLDVPPRRSLWQTLPTLAPGLGVLRAYPRRWLRADVFAGVAVAAYLVPQVMAYAAIVDVQPVAGLWTALAACLVYAVLGGSRVLSVGPESTVALLAGATVAPMADGDPVRVATLTSGLCLVVAAWCLIARFARLGVIADLLSQPLLVGYLAGGAVLMVVGQLGRVTGTTVDGESIVAQIGSFLDVVPNTHWATLAVAAGTLTLLLGVILLRPNWPGPLIAVAAATLASALLDLPSRGVKATGEVPSGLPGLHLPVLSLDDLSALVLAGLGVAIVAYSDNTLIGRAFRPQQEEGRPRENTDVDPQQELVALGGVHLASGLFGGFPVSSSGSRTALAIAAGARSQMYSLVAAGCIVAVLFVAGPLLAQLPSAALGAVVIYAASKLVSWHDIVRLARFRTAELILAALACVGTVVFGILAGVGIAIALSLLEMAQRLARPHEGVLGRVEGLAGMHDVDDYPDATTLPGLVVYRYDAPLFFANVSDLRRRAMLAVDLETRADPAHPVRWFILNVEANVEIDITAADGLRALHGDLTERGVIMALARVKKDMLEPLGRAGLVELIGEDRLFPTLPVAEEAYLTWAAAHPAPAQEAAARE